MFDPYNRGFHAVWDWNYQRPVKKQMVLARTEAAPDCASYLRHPPEPADILRWEEGYDAGLKACERWRAGYAVGIVNGSDENPCKDLPRHEQSQWSSGYCCGKEKFLRNALKPIIKVHQPWDYVLYSVHYPQDDPTGQTDDYPGGESYKPLTRKDVLDRAVGTLMDRYCRNDPVPTDMKGILQYAISEDREDGYEQLMTKKEMCKAKAEQEYAEMEKAAQDFAGSCGFKLGTVQFIRALENAVKGVRQQREHWNNPEVRHEEWAACQYAGVGQEVYFDDLNFENGRYSGRLASLDQVWNYLERKFPIMMLRYQEAKARKKKGTTNG